jgi:chromosome segregation ATPase
MTTERTPSEMDFSAMTDEQLNNFKEPDETLPQTESQTEPVTEPVPEPEVKAEEPEKADPVKELAEKLEKLEKQVRDKEAMIGRQSNMIGELRKQVQKPEPPIEKPTTTDFLTDPAAAVDKYLTVKQEEQKKILEQTQQFLENNKQTTLAHVPDFEEIISDIGKMLVEEDNLPAEEVKKVMQNPYVIDSAYLIQLGKRVQVAKKMQKIQEEMKGLKNKPAEVLAQLQQATRQAPSVKAGGDTLPKARTYTQADLARMSDAELDALEV